MINTKCKVHDVELLKGTAPIRYGLPPAPPVGYLEAQDKLFPNAVSFVLGGCILDDANEQTVSYCPLCREAERAWIGRPERNWFA